MTKLSHLNNTNNICDKFVTDKKIASKYVTLGCLIFHVIIINKELFPASATFIARVKPMDDAFIDKSLRDLVTQYISKILND